MNRGAAKHLNIEYAYQSLDDLPEGYSIPEGREKPWGTAHAVLSAKDVVNGPFAVINADDFYGRSAFKMAYDFLAGTSDGHFATVAYELKNTLTVWFDCPRTPSVYRCI